MEAWLNGRLLINVSARYRNSISAYPSRTQPVRFFIILGAQPYLVGWHAGGPGLCGVLLAPLAVCKHDVESTVREARWAQIDLGLRPRRFVGISQGARHGSRGSAPSGTFRETDTVRRASLCLTAGHASFLCWLAAPRLRSFCWNLHDRKAPAAASQRTAGIEIKTGIRGGDFKSSAPQVASIGNHTLMRIAMAPASAGTHPADNEPSCFPSKAQQIGALQPEAFSLPTLCASHNSNLNQIWSIFFLAPDLITGATLNSCNEYPIINRGCGRCLHAANIVEVSTNSTAMHLTW